MSALAKIRLCWFFGLLSVAGGLYGLFHVLDVTSSVHMWAADGSFFVVGALFIRRAKYINDHERAWKTPSVPSFNCAKCGVLVTTGQKYCPKHHV